MKKWKILPGMALRGVTSNGTVYYPYLVACIFAAFTYFVFSSIISNDLIHTLPHAAYAWVFLEIGRWLLGVILLLFLSYANSFLIKHRKKEIGLYSLLGLEKKHIGVMLFLETVFLYVIAMAGGILLGMVLAKLLFLLLLRLSNVPIEAQFVFVPKAFKSTLIYFAALFFINYASQLWELRKIQPIELFSGSRKGEKEPKLLWLWSLLGVAALAAGYSIAIRARVDSMIFTNFFLAVFWVIVGTNLLFTFGIVAFLKLLRRKKGTYYKAKNFITVSGMYYRMKKSAASLVNICIFSTMVIITLTCTISLYIGIEDVVRFAYPYDYAADFDGGSLEYEAVRAQAEEIAEKYGARVKRADLFAFRDFSCLKDENRFLPATDDVPYSARSRVYFLTMEDYGRLTGDAGKLSRDQVLVCTTGPEFNYDTVEFLGVSRAVKGQARELFPFPRADKESMNTEYILIVKDEAARDVFVEAYARWAGVEDLEAFRKAGGAKAGVYFEGTDKAVERAAADFALWCQKQEGFSAYRDGIALRADQRSMYGGLLFIGILFGLIFFMCLIIIMYYKQVSEGFEDRGSFEIMQKVGMSDKEIKGTIHRQILLVFALPLAGAMAHTAVGMFMVDRLMAVLAFFNTRLVLTSALCISLGFALVYGASYLLTAKTYYKIVKM